MKASLINVKFPPQWILSNQSSGKSKAVDSLIDEFKKKYADGIVVTVKKEFHQFSVIVANGVVLSVSDVRSLVISSLENAPVDEMGIKIEALDGAALKKCLESIGSSLGEQELEFFKKEFEITVKLNASAPDTQGSSSSKESAAFVSADNLIGMEGFKSWMSEVEKVAALFGEKVAGTNVINNITYLISINRGNGLSTILHLMAETLKKNRLVDFEGKRDFLEWKLNYSDSQDDFRTFEGLLNLLENAAVSGEGYKGIMSIDVSEWIDHLTDKRFDLLLNLVWEKRHTVLFVFTIPFVENTVLQKLYDRIDDVITVRVMKFVPPSDEQYFMFFKKFFEQYDMSVDESACSSFIMKITSEKNDGKFYGFNTVRKIGNEMLYSVIAQAAKEDKELPTVITAKDFEKLYGLDEHDGVTGLEQLNGMVALNEVKDKVREILSTVKLQKELYAGGKSQIKPCFHMMFTGNPGTGKTVVARIIGRIFKEEGLLPVGNFFEVSRKDFVGKFVGHTAPKTMEICRNAYGSVLFIDEAYMLANERDGFSSEAIGTLIAEMENNRDKMVVIFAGYAKELEELFDMNPGLRDRIPYKVNFPNYNKDELKEIFYMQLTGKVKFDEGFAGKADEFFARFPDSVINMRDFSNGRFVRNLAERIVSKAALRFEMANMDIADFELTESDFSVAVSDMDFQKLFNKTKPVKTIGF